MVNMNVELQATCAALGYEEGDQYIKEPDCLETVKDLIRFLKREDETCDIRRQLGETQILQMDLVPIIKQYKEDTVLLETVIRLMVNLTQPARLCFQNRIPDDKTTRNYYLEVESYLQAYKEAFADEALFAVLTKKLGDLLQLDWENRQEEDRLLTERIMILLRNILHVPPNPDRERRTDDDASIHDQVLWALHVSGMEDLLLYLASSDEEQQFSLHVLEIISLMFREQTPEQLASAGVSRSMSEKEKDERELEMVRQQERAKKKVGQVKLSSRHSRFGGTFTVSNVKSISNLDMIYHRSIADAKNMSFDHNKQPKKKPKNRRPITEVELTRRSTLSIRLFLKNFCTQFLENCYNPLMRAVKDTLMRSQGQENDETYYLWAMRFFMEFNRLYDFKVDLVGETLSVPTFHYVQTNLQNFHEMILTNKKEGIVWSRRMHLALKSYHELLHSLNAMDQVKDDQIRESAKVLKSNVFYMMEYRDIFVVLLKKFDETRQSRTFLMDLIESTHLFLKMLEHFCKSHRHLIVQNKKKKSGKRKKKPAQPAEAQQRPFSEQELEDMWDDVSGELSAIFQGRSDVPEGITPFDAASEIDVDEQRVAAMLRIHEALRQRKAGEAVALLRAAREVWPDREEFGRPEMPPEEEFMAVREIFFADIPHPARNDDATQPVDDNPEEEEEEVDETMYATREQEFNFKDFVMRFASPQIIRSCVILLADYRNNTTYTNHCIVKMLHRVSYECHVIGLLFQARLFYVFQKIMKDPACNTKHFQELRTFAKHVVRKFFEVAQTNKKVFVELFFWKTVKEAVELTEGYGTTAERARAVKQIWTEEQDMELQRLFDEFREANEPEMDVVDHVMVHMIDQTKTRRQIIKQLAYLGIIESAKELKAKKGTSRPREWREEEEMQLRELFEQYRNSDDPMRNILDNLSIKRSKPKVLDKILELGLTNDKKDLYKKRKSRKSKVTGDESDDDRDDAPLSDREEERPNSVLDEAPEVELPEPSSDESEQSSGESASDSESEDDSEPLYIQQIKAALKKVIKKGFTGSVEWIKKCLNRTADDREEDGDTEPIPIVPITDEQEDALENSTFRSFLKKTGIKPPANEQERFWRIPGHLKPDDLRSRAYALNTSSEPNKAKSGTKSSERYDTLKALAKQRKQTNKVRSTTKHKQKKKVAEVSNGMDDDNADRQEASSTSEVTTDVDSDTGRTDSPVAATPTVARSRVKRALDSDDSGDDTPGISSVSRAERSDDEATERPNKRPRIVQSDDDDSLSQPLQPEENLQTFPATVLSQPLSEDSESDIEDHVPLRRAIKKRAAIESDSDSD